MNNKAITFLLGVITALLVAKLILGGEPEAAADTMGAISTKTLVQFQVAEAPNGTDHVLYRSYTDGSVDATLVFFRPNVCDPPNTCNLGPVVASPCLTDTNHSGVVDFDDLAMTLGTWGVCPPDGP